jgi:hypothetical protein
VSEFFEAANRIARRMYLDVVEVATFVAFQLDEINNARDQYLKFVKNLRKKLNFVNLQLKDRVK